jgi:hypothetical protein
MGAPPVTHNRVSIDLPTIRRRQIPFTTGGATPPAGHLKFHIRVDRCIEFYMYRHGGTHCGDVDIQIRSEQYIKNIHIISRKYLDDI